MKCRVQKTDSKVLPQRGSPNFNFFGNLLIEAHLDETGKLYSIAATCLKEHLTFITATKEIRNYEESNNCPQN